MSCRTKDCPNEREKPFAYCRKCLMRDPYDSLKPGEDIGSPHKDEGTLAHFDRYIAGDR